MWPKPAWTRLSPDTDEQPQESSDVGQEVDPGHGQLVVELDDGRCLEEEVDDGWKIKPRSKILFQAPEGLF